MDVHVRVIPRSASVAIVSALVSQLSAELYFAKSGFLELKLFCTLVLKLFQFWSFAAEIYMLYLLLKLTPGRILSAEIYALVPCAETYFRRLSAENCELYVFSDNFFLRLNSIS